MIKFFRSNEINFYNCKIIVCNLNLVKFKYICGFKKLIKRERGIEGESESEINRRPLVRLW